MMSKVSWRYCIKYSILVLVTTAGFWFYFQLDTYPLKVARWLQPLEAVVLPHLALQCEGDNYWLEELLTKSVKMQGAYSVQAAHIGADGTKYGCSIGYKDNFFGEPVNLEHRYRYASVSKLVTAAAISTLVDQGKLNLDDRLVDLFPELSTVELKDSRVAEITIAHLLSHRAGFSRASLGGDAMFLRRKKPWCPNNFMHLANINLRYVPGTRSEYSNEGFCLLGAVIERVAGEPYREYLERQYHLGSRNILFARDSYEFDEVRYDFRYEEWYNDSYLSLFDFEAISSVAGLSGSASDLAQLLWDIHHRDSSVFTRSPVDAICYQVNPFGCLDGGIYFYQPNNLGLALYFHHGYLPGVSSLAVIDSEGGVTVVVKSGADRESAQAPNNWVGWVYELLSRRYLLAERTVGQVLP